MKKLFTHFKISRLVLLTALLTTPAVSSAQTGNLQGYLASITIFINETIIPLFFAIAILFLFVYITRYFVVDSADAYKREEARKYILYAIIALVFITSIWGIINLITDALGIGGDVPICPDYIQNGSGGCGDSGGGGGSSNSYDAFDI